MKTITVDHKTEIITLTDKEKFRKILGSTIREYAILAIGTKGIAGSAIHYENLQYLNILLIELNRQDSE